MNPLGLGRRPRIALAHDWLVGLRGGELVLDRIIRALSPHAEIAALYAMFDDGKPLTPAIDALPKRIAPLGRLPLTSTHLRRWLLPLYPLAVASLSNMLAADHAPGGSAGPIDLLVSTSSAAIKNITPPPPAGSVPHLCYIHSPARYIWSQAARYSQGSPAKSLGLRLARNPFKRWDLEHDSNVTTFIANSKHIGREVHRCYGRDAAIVHPPARTEFFTPDPTASRAANAPWLVVSALEPYKCIDLAIQAANHARHELIIAGSGSQRAALEAIAGPTVKFAGRVSDEALRSLYRQASVLLFPQVEDFGIVAVEAQACGTPVVARREGGSLDSITELTGALFDHPTAESLLAAIARCPHNPAACRANAERFSERRFDAEFLAHVRTILTRSAAR